jgi:hypothetical protein
VESARLTSNEFKKISVRLRKKYQENQDIRQLAKTANSVFQRKEREKKEK